MGKLSKQKKHLLSFVLFLVLLCAALYGCTRLTEDKTAIKTKGSFFKSGTNYDVIFMGTSHVYNGILPMELWQEYGISSYNWGYSNSTPAQNYYILQEVVKYTNPKVVVLDMNGLIEYEDMGNGKYRNDGRMQSHALFDCFPLSLNKIRAVYDLFDDYEDRNDFLWDFIVYHNRWDQLTMDDVSPELLTENGSLFLDGHVAAGIDLISPDEKLDNIESYTCYPYLIKTLEFCQSKGIKVLCVYLPHVMSEESQRAANTIGDIIAQYDGCDYVNMIYEDIISYGIDIYIDGGHVNYAGACKTTSWLGNYLRAHYELDDYSENAEWIANYQKYLGYRASVLQSETLFSNYLMLLKNPGFNTTVDLYDSSISEDFVIGSEMYFAGLSPTVIEDSAGTEGTRPDGAMVHITVCYQDGTVADDAWFDWDGEDGTRIITNTEN